MSPNGQDPIITDTRTTTVGQMQWRVNEFDGGRRYMLVATTGDLAAVLSVHFDAEQWAEFQTLVQP